MRTATGTTWEEDDYIVRLASGDVRAMTLEQLDAAFHDGRVGAGTPIVAPNRSGWSTLGELACLEPDDEPASLVPVVTASVAPPDDAELARVIPRSRRLVTIAMVAFVFAALGTVAAVTLRSRADAATVASAPARIEPPPPAAPPPAPVLPAPVAEPSPPPTGTVSATATQGTERTHAKGSADRKKKKPGARRK